MAGLLYFDGDNYLIIVVGKLLPRVDTSCLQPPASMVGVVSEWVESSPDFLYATPHHGDAKFPVLRSHPKQPSAHVLQLPITGIIQWCILAPLVVEPKTKISKNKEREMSTKSHSGTSAAGSKETGSGDDIKNVCDYQEQLARLHAELLSALLSISHSSSTSSSPSSLTSDDVAIIVATLLAFSQKLEVEKAKEKEAKLKVKPEPGWEVKKEGVFIGCGENMEQCVERFAQFLQISLSTKVLQLKSGTWLFTRAICRALSRAVCVYSRVEFKT